MYFSDICAGVRYDVNDPTCSLLHSTFPTLVRREEREEREEREGGEGGRERGEGGEGGEGGRRGREEREGEI